MSQTGSFLIPLEIEVPEKVPAAEKKIHEKEDVGVEAIPNPKTSPAVVQEPSPSQPPAADKNPTELFDQVLDYCSTTEIPEAYQKLETSKAPKKFCHDVGDRQRYLAISQAIDGLPEYQAMHRTNQKHREERRKTRRMVREFNNRPGRMLFRPWS